MRCVVSCNKRRFSKILNEKKIFIDFDRIIEKFDRLYIFADVERNR